MSRELKAAVEAAKEVGASIYLVDRPYRITQNRLAEKILNPYLFSNLMVYGRLSLMNRNSSDSSAMERFLREEASPIYKVLVEERCQYMTKLIHEQARKGESVVVVCSALHVPGIKAVLESPDVDDIVDSIKLEEILWRGLPLWPVLLLVYFILPISLVVYVWSLLVSGLLSVFRKLFLPPHSS